MKTSYVRKSFKFDLDDEACEKMKQWALDYESALKKKLSKEKTMLKIVNIDRKEEGVISFSEISKDTPIFAKKDGVLAGMVVREGEGWILRLGGDNGSSFWHANLLSCLQSGVENGYEFYVNT
jgi:hypothetical protein